MTHLFWFRNDLRLEDNPGLSAAAAQAERLLCVYCWPRDVPWCNTRGMGVQRRRFLLDSLAELRRSLRARGQELVVLHGAPERELARVAAIHGVTRIGVAAAPGVYEAADVRGVRRAAGAPLDVHPAHTLFSEGQLERRASPPPLHFTPFRRRLEGLAPAAPMGAPVLPPPPPGISPGELPEPDCQPHPAFPARGGREAGMRRLQQWMFREDGVATYLQTRNDLEGQFFASQLSPWLALGCLSVREVAGALADYEGQRVRNDSTGHYFSELLWREFFHWRALVDGKLLFRRGGLRGRVSLRCFDPRNFARWCAGDTNYPLVNALMHQLVETGFMSNRGRQITASCLVNELKLDWRYGAAFFEKHLIDYDVSSNYGNWQYIAGVGTDPRGGRHFDIARQASLYDPDGEFTARWDGHRAHQPEYAVDAADWPIQ